MLEVRRRSAPSRDEWRRRRVGDPRALRMNVAHLLLKTSARREPWRMSLVFWERIVHVR